MLQIFEHGPIRDIFGCFSPDELGNLLKRNNILSAQLKAFVDITRSNRQLISNEIDLLGQNNLAVVGSEGHERLLLLDPHFRAADVRKPKTEAQIRKRVSYLDIITQSVSGIQTPKT
jgi:hypothetical protein